MRARMVAAAVILSAGLIVYGAIGLYRSDVFLIQHIEVVGNAHLSSDEVLSLASVPEESTLLRFPGDEVRQRLEADPWISRAYVSRDFPDTMRLRIEERLPAAYLDFGGADLWIIDGEGFVIGEQTAETTTSLVVIRDVEGADPVLGEKTLSEPVLNALAVLQGLSDDLRRRVRAISAPDIDRTSLITTDDIEIVVGSREDLSVKDEIARRILDDHSEEVVYINVRTVDHPVWKGVDTQ